MSRKDGHFFLKLEVRVWLTDRALSKGEPATRGIWLDLLCGMHTDDDYMVAGTAESLSRMARCTPLQMLEAIADLKSHNVATVTERDGIITLVSRRMQREWNSRKSNADRQKRHRNAKGNDDSNAEDNGAITGQSKMLELDVRSKSKKQQTLVGLEEPKPDPITVKYAELRMKWNTIPDRYRTACRGASPKRMVAIRARLKQVGWWQECLNALEKMLLGQCAWFGNNDRGWKPNIEWFLKPDSVLNILEGKYDNAGNNGSGKDNSGKWG